MRSSQETYQELVAGSALTMLLVIIYLVLNEIRQLKIRLLVGNRINFDIFLQRKTIMSKL